MIRQNRHKYSVSALCDILQLSRSTFYYEAKVREQQQAHQELTRQIVQIFRDSRSIYGQRKIKRMLEKQGEKASRRRISRIMREQGLVSKYTVAQFKPHKTTCNEEPVTNVLNREFNQAHELKVVVSDLTYVRVQQNWHYICVLVDLYNREIIGYSAGPSKDAQLVYRAFATVKDDLNRLE